MDMMKAVGFKQFGGAEVLEVIEVARPEVKPDSVLIRVAAAGVNPADWLIRSGRFKLFMGGKLPFIPGADVAGVVEQVGATVTRFRPGDAVYAMLPNLDGGGYAAFAVAAEDTVAHVPANLTLAEAAAVPLAALTALQGLRGHLQPGMRVLVNGASGGVGTFAVQIAKALGAQVTAVVSTRNLALARDLGADEVIDYTTQDVTRGGTRFDMIYDAVGLVPFRRWRRIIKPGGTVMTVNFILGSPLARLMARVTSRARLDALLVRPDATDLATISAWVAAGQVRPVIDQTYPMAQAAEAHRYSESKRVRGKLVIIIDDKLAGQRASSNSYETTYA